MKRGKSTAEALWLAILDSSSSEPVAILKHRTIKHCHCWRAIDTHPHGNGIRVVELCHCGVGRVSYVTRTTLNLA